MTTTSNHDDEAVSKESVRKLIKQKDTMEMEIKQLLNELDSSSAGRTGNLVDKDGFPRNDIDINAIRVMRNRVAILQNDHIALMKQIEKDLVTLHEQSKTSGTGNNNNESSAKQQEQVKPVISLQPFAFVNAVAPDSPASECGLQKGDQVLQFGSVTKSQVEKSSLSVLAQIVEANVNKNVLVRVRREGIQDHLDLTLVPKPWSGRGYLGCHLLPIN
jgi:26S proteasome non-ATPase regulatory subunit 9